MNARAPVLDTTAWGLLLALSLVWGGSFFFAEVALAVLPPLTIVLARLAIGAAGLWLIIAATRTTMPSDRMAWRDLAVMGILNNAIPFGLIVWGQIWITGGLASVLNATTPVLSVVAAHLLTDDEKMTPNRLAGVVLGFLGVVVLMGPSVLGELGGHTLGSVAVLGAAVSYAAAGLWGRRLRHLFHVMEATRAAARGSGRLQQPDQFPDRSLISFQGVLVELRRLSVQFVPSDAQLLDGRAQVGSDDRHGMGVGNFDEHLGIGWLGEAVRQGDSLGPYRLPDVVEHLLERLGGSPTVGSGAVHRHEVQPGQGHRECLRPGAEARIPVFRRDAVSVYQLTDVVDRTR